MEYTHNRDSNYYVLFDLEDVKETTYLTTYIKNKERHFQKIFAWLIDAIHKLDNEANPNIEERYSYLLVKTKSIKLQFATRCIIDHTTI